MPRVSIVVPVYNVDEKDFARCMGSLLGQSLADIEIILVDDGSTNGSAEWCDAYAEADARVSALHQPNLKSAVARNTGLAAARGEFITFLDSDDWAEPDLCERAVAAFEARGVDVVLWAYTLERGKMEPVTSRIQEEDGLIPGGAHLQALMLYNLAGRRRQPYFNMIGSPWTKMYRRSLLADNEIFFDPELPRAQDIEHSRRAFAKAGSAWYLARPAYHHVFVTAGSASRRYLPDFGQLYHRACAKMLAQIRAEGSPPEVLAAYYVLACVLMLGVGPNSAFSPDNPNPVKQQIADYRDVTRLPAFAEAVRRAEAAVLPPSHQISVFLVRRRLYPAIYLICKLRRLQMKLWH